MTAAPHIWLAYVNYSVTTAIYLKRALEPFCRITTIGPAFPDELLDRWQLREYPLPEAVPHRFETEFEPDMAKIVADIPQAELPDLYLWVESVMGHFPENLSALRCPKACFLIDSHLSNRNWHLIWGKQFDYVFIAQREYIPEFRAHGINAYWLPLGCDPVLHGKQDTAKRHEIGFVGSKLFNDRRLVLLDELQKTCQLHYERCYLQQMAKVFSESKIVFNNATKRDLNMRVFEALCSGSFLLTDPAPNSGLEELFHDGEELAIYRSDAVLPAKARFYLDNSELRELIASRGRQLALNAHTYSHRMSDMLAVLNGTRSTTLTAAELRERSLEGMEPPFSAYCKQNIHFSNHSRSFVIAVLDYSPASEFNIVTLLQDLEQIPGEVLVIFNDEQVAADLRNHPRITRYAIMKENIGVARAWNVGIEMAATPTVFILNADLHLEPEAVQAMENGLLTLNNAACVGPQGSFVNYQLAHDYLYFDKAGFDSPISVDAISGFLFAIKRELFGPGGLKFEESYTPCYFEEWDLGIQIRQKGMNCWVVPTTAYMHHWSGSIAARREIDCMGRSETAADILQRNRILFLTKWQREAARSGKNVFDSNVMSYLVTVVPQLLAADHAPQARALAESLVPHLPENPELLVITGYCHALLGDAIKGRELLKQAFRIAPERAETLLAVLESSGMQHRARSLS